jgi:hypothetical protein
MKRTGLARHVHFAALLDAAPRVAAIGPEQRNVAVRSRFRIARIAAVAVPENLHQHLISHGIPAQAQVIEQILRRSDAGTPDFKCVPSDDSRWYALAFARNYGACTHHWSRAAVPLKASNV